MNKNDFFFICQRVWKTKNQGKDWEKSGNLEVNDKWQPCPRREVLSQGSLLHFIKGTVSGEATLPFSFLPPFSMWVNSEMK